MAITIKPNRIGKIFTGAGYGLGLYNAYDIENQNNRGQLNKVQYYSEHSSNAFSTLGGIYGAAWGIGWEGGRLISKTDFWRGTVKNQFIIKEQKCMMCDYMKEQQGE